MAGQPSLQTIRFRIRADGRVEETVEGLVGASCERLTEQIEDRIGSLQQRRPTAEAFLSQTLDQTLTAGAFEGAGAGESLS
ncbi:MAG: DUF2997 domain-containing protein [Cyanobacteriota bacterium]|nr:DUF2997 domain-containing protein [Cyanobacteriota bacterium]